MEDMKKRKLGEASTDGETSSEEEMRLLLDPLPKPQLVHLLSKLYVSFYANPTLFHSFPGDSYGFCLLGLSPIPLPYVFWPWNMNNRIRFCCLIWFIFQLSGFIPLWNFQTKLLLFWVMCVFPPRDWKISNQFLFSF